MSVEMKERVILPLTTAPEEDVKMLQTSVCPSPKTTSHLPERPLVDIEFTDLSYSVPQGRNGNKMILRNVSGLFRSGELTAILGPSGAGKSTLLNVLAGYKCADVTGSISINGHPRNLRQFRKLSRYIMQEDRVQPHLTVHEAMMIAADLKLGSEVSTEQKLKSVEEILYTLRLLGTKETRTTLISGGEKKRLSVALEMINNPPVIFLDEPTTGLDDLSSSQCLSLLKTLAQGGRTVICSIHTPSAKLFSMFDNVYIVAAGQCVFQGQGTDIVPFLEGMELCCPKHYNPADFVIEVSSGEYGDHLEKMVAAVDNGHCYRWTQEWAFDSSLGIPESWKSEHDPLPLSGKEFDFDSSSWMQFRILCYRMLLQSWRDFDYLLLKFSMNIFLGFIIGGLFFQIGLDGSKTLFNYGFCVTCIIVFMYIPMLPVLLYFPSEVQLVKREYFNRWYSLNSYFWAMTVARLPVQAFLGCLYFLMIYLMTGQPLEFQRGFQFLIICLLISFVSESLGHAVSSAFSIVNGMFMGPALSVPLMLLATYGTGTGSFNVPILVRIAMYFSYLRYGLEGLVWAIYGNRGVMDCPTEETYCPYRYPKVLLKEVGMEDSNIYISIAALIVFFFVFKGICYFILRWRFSTNKSFAALNVIVRFVKSHFNLIQYR